MKEDCVKCSKNWPKYKLAQSVEHTQQQQQQQQHFFYICLFKKLLFTMENATAADSSQSNISRVYIWKDKPEKEK